jgi:very-short-patch-repair endonuclease
MSITEGKLHKSRQKLLDLSLRNRLLNFRPGNPAHQDDLKSHKHVVLKGHLDKLWEQLVTDERRIRILGMTKEQQSQIAREILRQGGRKSSDRTEPLALGPIRSQDWESIWGSIRDIGGMLAKGSLISLLPEEPFQKRLKRIRAEQNTLINSTGDSALFLGIGFLEWCESEPHPKAGEAFFAPLILVHSSLEENPSSEGGDREYFLSMDADQPQGNPCLVEKLRQDFGLDLPELEEDETAVHYLSRVGRALRNKKEWRVHDNIALGFFNFARYRLWLDLDPKVWPQGGGPADHAIVRSIVNGDPLPQKSGIPSDDEVAIHQETKDLPLVLDSDSTQYAALLAAQNEVSGVIQGPPGSGKSQTITNLIAIAIAAGKRVLFVAQKLPALQVVQRRLKAVQLDSFCLPLFSDKARVTEVHKHLEASAQMRQSPDRPDTLLNRTVTMAKRLNGHAARLRREPRGYSMSAGNLIQRAIARRMMLRTEWGEHWKDSILEIQAPVGDPSPDWTERREQTLHQWHRLRSEVGEVWTAWEPIRLGPMDTPKVELTVRQLANASTALSEALACLPIELHAMTVPQLDQLDSQLAQCRFTALQDVIPALLAFLWEAPANSVQVARLEQEVDEFKRQTTQAELVLRLSPENRQYVADRTMEALREVAPILSKKRSIIDATRDLKDLEALLGLAVDLFTHADRNPQGVAVLVDAINAQDGQSPLTWRHVDVLTQHRTNRDLPIPLGSRLRLAKHVLDDKSRLSEARSFIQKLTRYNSTLERLGARVGDISKLRQPECLQLLDQGTKDLSASALGTLRLGELGVFTGSLVAARRALEAVHADITTEAMAALLGEEETTIGSLLDLAKLSGLTVDKATPPAVGISAVLARLEFSDSPASELRVLAANVASHNGLVEQLTAWFQLPQIGERPNPDVLTDQALVATTLAELGLKTHPLGEVPQIHERIARLRKALQEALERMEVVFAAWPILVPETAAQLQDAKALFVLLANRPPAPEELRIEPLCSSINAEVVTAAILESSRLNHNRKGLASHVSIIGLPDADRIANTSRVLKSFAGVWWRWLSSEYRSARKAAMACFTPPIPSDQDLVRLLESLETHVRESVMFDQSPCGLLLGTLFKGTETNWQMIEPTLHWLRGLKEATQIEEITPFVLSAIHDGDQLRQAARAVEVLGHLIEQNRDSASTVPIMAELAAEPSSIRLKDLLATLRRSESRLEVVCQKADEQIRRMPTSACVQLVGNIAMLQQLDESVLALEIVSQRVPIKDVVVLVPSELMATADWLDMLTAHGVNRRVIARMLSGHISINRCTSLIAACASVSKAVCDVLEYFQNAQNTSWLSLTQSVASMRLGLTTIENAVVELANSVSASGVVTHLTIHGLREVLADIDEVEAVEATFRVWQDILGEDPSKVDPATLTGILDWLEEIKGLGASGRLLQWLLSEECDSRFIWWQESITRANAFNRRVHSLQDRFGFPLREADSSRVISVWAENNLTRLAQGSSALAMIDTCTLAADFTIQEIAEAVSCLHRSLSLEAPLAIWQERLGIAPTSLETRSILAHRQWATTARTLPSALSDWLVADETNARCVLLKNLGTHLNALKLRFDDVDRTLNSFGKVAGTGPFAVLDRSHTPQSIETCSRHFLNALPLLPNFADLLRAKESARKLGLQPLLDGATNADISVNLLLDSFRGALAHQQAKAVLEDDEELRLFRSSEHERLRDRFQAEDGRQLENNRKFIRAILSNGSVTQGAKGRLAREHTEFTLLQFEMGKKRKHIPIRKLVQRAGRAMLDLCPCWMMTPTAVAQFLPPGPIEFDLVIMDEASQLNPEDAWGAITRGKQLLVVGDPKQMPPSDFFTSALEEEESPDEEEEVDGGKAESILEASMTSLLSTSLLWHYRSRQESLIAPANSFSYGNRLILFPHPHREHPDLGIRYTYIPDAAVTTGKVTNSQEAAAVARRVKELVLREFAKPKPEDRLSIGVVTMNLPQQDCINDLLDKMRQDDRRFDLAMSSLESESNEEPLFTRNLENIQGDERDIMILSCTYGPTKAGGTPAQRFGPLNREGGERRFNVLITRAKCRMEVFASMRSDQIIADGKRQGVQDFHLFLKYAETGMLADAGHTTNRPADSPFEVQVEAVLLREGLMVERQVGVAGYFIDLAVKHPTHKGLFALGIECDGETYHSSRAARDRDRLRENVLRDRGWKLHRIWSTDWFVNPAQAKARLLAAVKSACSS